jgi:hypothetical protein
VTLHLLKLAVGIDRLSDLVARQENRLAEMARAGERPELIHVTRNNPRRVSEILGDGSLYWVVKGFILARQKLLELRPIDKDGIAHCAFVYESGLIAVEPRPHRAFQGWRYLDPKDAPRDIAARGRNDSSNCDDLPEVLRRELIALGLL